MICVDGGVIEILTPAVVTLGDHEPPCSPRALQVGMGGSKGTRIPCSVSTRESI